MLILHYYDALQDAEPGAFYLRKTTQRFFVFMIKPLRLLDISTLLCASSNGSELEYSGVNFGLVARKPEMRQRCQLRSRDWHSGRPV